MSALAASQRVLAAARAGVDRDGLADDETILHEFTDLLACKDEAGRGNEHKDQAKPWPHTTGRHFKQSGHFKLSHSLQYTITAGKLRSRSVADMTSPPSASLLCLV